MVRYRPISAVRVFGPVRDWIVDGLLDTGADDTVFPAWLAPVIGFDLTSVAPHPVQLAGRGPPVPCRFLQARLRITNGLESHEWRAMIGFVPLDLKHALLGQTGCLQFFDSDFRGSAREVELTPNTSFPGVTTGSASRIP